MCTIYICMRKCVGVTEAQINVRLCGKVENCVNIVSLQAVHDLRRVCDIAMVECEISFVIEDSRVVQGSTVVELVEGNDVVGIGIGQCEMSYKPASTVAAVRRCSCNVGANNYLHEASSSCDHNILNIGQWFEFGTSN